MVNKDSYMPYYMQIYNELKSRIDSMMYRPGEILPSENELVEEFNVTRVTIRNAIKKLKDEGIIRTEKGKGSFVNQPKLIQSLDRIYSFGKDIDEQGYNLEREVLEIYKEIPDSYIKKHLQLQEGELVIAIKAVRKLEDKPVIIQMSYIPLKVVPDVTISDLKSNTIYNVFETKYNIKLLKAKEYLDPIAADEWCSNALGIDIGNLLFLTERITYAAEEIPVEYRKCYIRSDKFRFSVELE